MTIFDRLKDINLKNGGILSDKTWAFDAIYITLLFIKDNSVNDIFDYGKYSSDFFRYVFTTFNLVEPYDSPANQNYVKEALNHFTKVGILKKIDSSRYQIIDMDLMNYILSRKTMENAFIYLYCIGYYSLKNGNILPDYIAFCNTNSDRAKEIILERISRQITNLIPTISDPESQWAKQNTKYYLRNMNYINGQPDFSRNLKILEDGFSDGIESISANKEGTRSTKTKNNAYLSRFDESYVTKEIKNILIA